MTDRTLEAAALHLAAIVEFSDDAIVSKDLQGIITSWNRAAERMFGYTAAEAIGRSITLIVPKERLSDEDHVLGEIRAGRAVDHFETVRRRKDGTYLPVSLTVSPIHGPDGTIVGASKIARDISERRRAEATLALHAPTIVELPFEHQRRAAAAAVVEGRTRSGTSWRLRVADAHLDTALALTRGGPLAARRRQAVALVEALAAAPEDTVLGGDFNTWFGFSDQAYIETARAFPETRVDDRRATFHGLLRLDHVFFRLAPGWRAEFRRASSRFGSDHYPLVGTLRFN